MKTAVSIVCEGCGQQLAMPARQYEERVRGRIVRVRCNGCGESIRVDGTMTQPPLESPAANSAPSDAPVPLCPPADADATAVATPSESEVTESDFVESDPSMKEESSESEPTSVACAQPSARIGRYALFDEFAKGGMAVVHFGRLDGAGGFSRVVAIKRLLPHLVKNQEFTQMLLREAQLAARVRHPHVVPTLDVVASKGDVLLVLEYVHGESLGALCRTQAKQRREHIPIEITASVMNGVLQGLQAVHDATDGQGRLLGLVHRDISPPNVIVGADGLSRVLDFGIAKAFEHLEESLPNQLKGKSGYMSPEQIRGEPLTQRSDVFAAGILLWEMLAMRRLFSAQQEADRMEMILSGNYPSPTLYRPELSADLEQIVLRALAPDPEARFASSREFALALEQAVHAAPAHRVAEWVMDLASEALATRAQQVAHVENWVDEEGEIPLNSSPFTAELLSQRPRAASQAPPASTPEAPNSDVPVREVSQATEPVPNESKLPRSMPSRMLLVALLAMAGLGLGYMALH